MESRSLPVSTGTTPFMWVTTSSPNSLMASSVAPAIRSASLLSRSCAALMPRALIPTTTTYTLALFQSEQAEQ